VLGGVMFDRIGLGAPYLGGVVLVALAVVVLSRSTPQGDRRAVSQGVAPVLGPHPPGSAS